MCELDILRPALDTVFLFNSIEKYKRIYIKPDDLQFSRKGVSQTVYFERIN